jgi:hypothetical protein
MYLAFTFSWCSLVQLILRNGQKVWQHSCHFVTNIKLDFFVKTSSKNVNSYLQTATFMSSQVELSQVELSQVESS